MVTVVRGGNREEWRGSDGLILSNNSMHFFNFFYLVYHNVPSFFLLFLLLF
jgi:hypothetical protein